MAMRFKVGDLAIANVRVVEEACGDHPMFVLAEKGQRLIIQNKYPAEEYPKHGVDSYLVQDEYGKYGDFYMDCSELDKPTKKQLLKPH